MKAERYSERGNVINDQINYVTMKKGSDALSVQFVRTTKTMKDRKQDNYNKDFPKVKYLKIV